MKRAIVVTLLIGFLMSVGLTGYGYFKYTRMTGEWFEPLHSIQSDQWRQDEEPSPPNEQKKKEQRPRLDPFTIMILGVDTRGEKKARSDTIILAAVNPTSQQVKLLSIPRDTLVKIPGYGQDKFNHAMFYGGAPLVKQTIEDFLGIKVDRYATIDFEGFIKLVDSLDGVKVDVKRRMKYRDPSDGTEIDLHPGLQQLDGKQALDYARFRKSEIGSDASDFDRMDRQQEVMKQLADKATRFTTLFRVFKLMDILEEHVKTDLTSDEIGRLAILFKGFSSSEIETMELGGTSRRMPKHGYNLWFHVVSDEEKKRIQHLIQKTLEDDKLPETAGP
ncbi:hypothetical protein BEP19_05230 [Ammoniphilus oxalaticus]|uniref:Cell envelope-related transcriptional attenuator domain-containing protein n=1 Tax=Ammoniphilus oxalaticus TaxID=66863 RepID=A0A419SIJ9_9BACL|nr:LCP family protein [Ammoniphilus oxalaticus]RKD23833.1 hypothetical protein BEP19_05230 [Ammoniphilus oxalaticus]